MCLHIVLGIYAGQSRCLKEHVTQCYVEKHLGSNNVDLHFTLDIESTQNKYLKNVNISRYCLAIKPTTEPGK